MAEANLVDPAILVTAGDGLTFTLAAQGGIAPFAWIDHPSGTVGVFKEENTDLPLNGFFLFPGMERTGAYLSMENACQVGTDYSATVRFELNDALSSVSNPDPANFVVRSVWNNTHL